MLTKRCLLFITHAPKPSTLKLLVIIAAIGITGGTGALVGVALAQQTEWIRPLAEEYSLVYKAAYDEANEHGLFEAGREVVAEQVLYAYIATRSSAHGNGASSPPGGEPNVTPTLGPSPTPTPTPTPTPAATITTSDVDGYHSNFRVDILVSSIGVNLSMSRVNTYTANGSTVKLTSDGTLTTGAGGTPLKDRYYWACNPVNGSIGEGRTYASDQHNVSLRKTNLDNAPLLRSGLGERIVRICAGNESAPASSATTSWGQSNSF